MKKLISIVIPAFNEEAVLDELERRLQGVMAANASYDFEVIIVENGSSDSTFQKLMYMHFKDSRFKVVQLSRNFGYEGAITAGLKYANGDAVVMMCADLQDPPEMVTQFIKKWEDGYEVVYAMIKKREGVSALRKILYSNFYRVIHWLTNDIIPENVSEFRLMDRSVYIILNSMEERNRFIRGIVAWTGFKQTGISFERPPRFAGESKADFATILSTAMNGIFSFSYLPLKLATIIGFVISIASFTMIFIELGLYLVYGRVVPGYYTTLIIIFFLFGMLFVLFGIMGMYIGRIYDEVKQRPIYIVRKELGFDETTKTMQSGSSRGYGIDNA
ncbi:UDP-N-acetylglucosamine--dolichyl-phosphate N-acetylglucosaminyltransferase [uncultured archaeon]|nr:UDP-N-acetylglucosamine--dolichyl-phosphate N-acetylglucosaminyltransferase [uncultured archaeon]